MRRAFLFDLDGTLIDSDPLHFPVFAAMFAERGRQIDHAFYMARIHGRLNAHSFGEAFPGADTAALSDEKEARFRARLGASHPPMPGLPALLGRARRAGLKLAVVTNAPRANAAAMLAATGLDGAFDSVVLAEDCAAGKPDPAPYLEALRRLGVAPHAAVAFEDSPSGLAAAVAAGIHAVGVRSGLTDAALRAAGAAMTIEDFNDPALDALFARQKGHAA
ncbi:MAG: HAD family phosphatase [Rhodobacteraceae bacterium]|nr:HAD family phosphatase [Paracoccaceae bacterium]